MLKPNYDRIYFEVPKAIKERLELYCKQMRMTKTEVLRNAIEGLILDEDLDKLKEELEPNEELKQLMRTEAPWNELKQRDKLTPITKPEIRPWLQSLVDEAEQDLAIADQLRTMADSYRDQMYAIAQILEDR